MKLDKNRSEVPRILIVDDVEANRFLLRDIVKDMGYLPVLAENGVQALKIFPKCHPWLILLDVAMPQMDGYEFCKIIKKDPNAKNIPIIFISAFDNPYDVVQGFKLGGEDYITRPFVPKVIKSRVGVHLKLYAAKKELIEMNRRLKASVNEQARQLEQEKKDVLYALANVARENSDYDDEHLERMQINCRILAQGMQFSPLYEQYISDEFVDTIGLAAPLSDIGNVATPIELLKKREKLTAEEMEIIRRHTTIGVRILRDIYTNVDDNDFIRMTVEVAYNHHENWDGSGYPMGKKGDEIPLSAQIVSLVSEYCALTENRSYRSAFSKDEALKMMEKDEGTKFSVDIYRIFRKISRQLR